MDALHDQIDSEEGEEHNAKACYREYGRPPPSPSGYKPPMKNSGIDEPGYQGPDFVWVPSPVFAPGAFCPYDTGYDSKREERPPDCDQPVVDLVKHLEAWQT